MELGTASMATARAKTCLKWHQVDNFLPKSEGGVIVLPMPNRTLAMSTAMIHERAKPFRPARRFSAVDLRIDDGRPFLARPRGKGPR